MGAKNNHSERFNGALMGVQCDYCEELFAPTRRLDVVSQKGIKGHPVNRQLCPLCRRTNLVVDYIEKYRVPEGKAEYRSAKDILRKAQKRIDEEKARGS